MQGRRVFFYGRLASATKRDAERAARDAGYRVSSTLDASVDLVVLGEEEPLAQSRAQLASEFDARSREAFESGRLEVLSETDFFRRALERVVQATSELATTSEPLFAALKSDAQGPNEERSREDARHTPAAVAELVGSSIASIRRQYRRGFLTATFERDRLPLFSTREVLVAKRLAFLLSSGLTEEFAAKRILAFGSSETAANERELTTGSEFDALRAANFDVGAVILNTTLSSDGREILFLGERGPIDWRGQLQFDFSAFPTDGSFETPDAPPALSEDEEQIALAERLAAWNAETTAATGKPGFLALFSGEEDSEFDPLAAVPPGAFDDARAFNVSTPPSSPLAAIEEPRSFAPARSPSVFELCERAWRLEREGYWEEAEREYRAAALSGGHDPYVCYRLGKVLFLLGDYPGARERFYCALELDAQYVDARIELGKTFVALGDLNDAQTAFTEAAKLRSDDPALRVELGKLYLRLERPQEAEAEFRAAIGKIDDQKLADDIRRLLLALAVKS